MTRLLQFPLLFLLLLTALSFAVGPAASVASAETTPYLKLKATRIGGLVDLTASGTPMASYIWDEGDGLGYYPGHGSSAKHTVGVTEGEERTIKVRGTTADGATAEAEYFVTAKIIPPIDYAVIITCNTLTPVVRAVITCTASGDFPAEGTTYEWAWGDGARSTGKTASHAPLRSGSQELQVVVSGDWGADIQWAGINTLQAPLRLTSPSKRFKTARKSGISFNVAGAGSDEVLTCSVRFRGVKQVFQLTANKTGAAKTSFKPNKLMRKVMVRDGLVTFRVASATSKGQLDFRLR
jgi:hypothetical protein